MLAYGHKRWFLTPPAAASFSTVPVRQWLTRHYPLLRARGAVVECTQVVCVYIYIYICVCVCCRVECTQVVCVVECTQVVVVHGPLDRSICPAPRLLLIHSPLEQEAGDVMYVPAGWGHAVLNLATCVGTATNFHQPYAVF